MRATSELTTVLTYALVPGLAALAGGAMAEAIDISHRRLSLALHGAAGVVVGIVALELMPRALEAAPTWLVVASFLGGGLVFLAVDRATDLVPAIFGEDAARGPWPLMFGMGLDLLTDGIMIGAGTTVSSDFGLALAVGLLAVDLPEGFSTTAAFKRGGVARRTRLGVIAALAASVPAGALLGFVVLRDAPLEATMAVLALTAGALMTLLLEEIAPEAHRGGEERLATLAFLLGFAAYGAPAALL